MDLHGKDILVIEDDQHIFALIEAMLETYNVNLVLKTDGDSGLTAALNQNFHLVLLDIMLPKKDGWEICRELKNTKKNIPIIMLTAKVEEADKVLGLEMGADDYVTKPFSPRELIARIKAVLRRVEEPGAGASKGEELTFPEIDLKIETNNYNVYVGDKPVTLAPKEFELLTFMARHPEQVFKREQLLDKIWGFDNYTETRTIDEHVKRIRKKLSDSGIETSPLQTVWGVGYKFTTDISED